MKKLTNTPLALMELESLARKGIAVWCVDTGKTACGVLCMMKNWWDEGLEAPYINLPNEEGGMNAYNVEFMMELGARFYRCMPGGVA